MARLEDLADNAWAATTNLAEFAKENAATISRYNTLKKAQDEAIEELKVGVRAKSVIGEHVVVIDDSRWTVTVTGKKKWNQEKVAELFPSRIASSITITTKTINTKAAQALLDAGKIDQRVAELVWEADTPAVMVRFK